MPTVSFFTLGCRLNFADTGGIRSEFGRRGFETVPFGSRADVTVINSCSVTEEADRKCRQVVRRAVRASPFGFVVVTGCYAQLQPGRLSRMDGVDAVLGTAEKHRLFEILGDFDKSQRTQVAVSCVDDAQDFGPAASGSERTRAFLKLQDGCDYSCAFCTIPKARGRSRSSPIDDAVAQARALGQSGVPEVVITGVNLGLYADGEYTLLDLLRRLDAETDVPRFRISSIEPNLVTNDIVDFVASSRAFMRHFHIPLQSGDDDVLGLMRRRYRAADYRRRVEYIRRVLPDACVGADVIVGHPGETESRFAASARFVDSLPVNYLHVFTYSERPDTVATEERALRELSIPRKIRRERSRTMSRLSQEKRENFLRDQQGKTVSVVWEGYSPGDARLFGYSENFLRLHRKHDPRAVGTIERVIVGPGGTVSPVAPGPPAAMARPPGRE